MGIRTLSLAEIYTGLTQFKGVSNSEFILLLESGLICPAILPKLPFTQLIPLSIPKLNFTDFLQF